MLKRIAFTGAGFSVVRNRALRQGRERRSRAFQIVRLGAAFAASSCALAAGAAGLYSVELAAPPTAHTAIDFRLSGNDRGQVAFAATDATDNFSKVFLWDCPGDIVGPCPAPAAVSFFGSGRDFSGAALRSAATTEVASRDRVSGAPPRFLLRKWNQGAFVELGDSGSPDLTFGSATGFISINNAGNVVATTTDAAINPQVQFFIGNNPIGSATAEGAALTLPVAANAIPRPQLAQATDKFVMKFLAANTGTGTDEIAIVNPQGQKTFVTRNAQTNDNPYSALGDVPGISENGDIVAFAASRPHPVTASRGIHVWIKTANQTTIFPVAWEGAGGITSLANALANRVAVISQKGPVAIDPVTKKPRHFEFVSVAFVADAPASGVYSIDLLLEVFENYIPMSNPAVDYVKLVAVSKLTTIAKTGDVVNGQTLTGNFLTWGPFLMLRGGSLSRTQDDTLRPVIAFSAEVAGPKRVVIRAIRNCSLDPSSALSEYKQYQGTRANASTFPGDWAGVTLHTSQSGNHISAAGCALTSASNVLNHFSNMLVLDPGLANEVFGNKPFTIVSGVPSIQQSASQTTRRIDALNQGDLDFMKAGGLMNLLAAPVGYLSFDQTQLPDPVPAPALSPTIAEEPLAPVADFFLCNGEPVIVKVFNCTTPLGGLCSGHYLVAKSKAVFTRIADGLGASSYAINDPGFANPTELLNTFSYSSGTVFRANRIAGVRAYTRQSVAGMKEGRALSLTVLSPVDVRITDPLGRSVDLIASGTGLNQIPNAYFSEDTFADPDGTTQMSEGRHLVIGGPADALGDVENQGSGLVDGEYTIDVTGTGTGPFTIRVASHESDGNIRTRTVRGNASAGFSDQITFTIATAPAQMFKLARASLPNPAAGDVDLNGVVDAADVAEIQGAVGGNSDGPGDPRDLNGDGTITQQDVTLAQPGPAATLDIDGSNAVTRYDALTDGLLAVRYMLGLTGSALTSGALGGTATRNTPELVKAYLDTNRLTFDIDGDGNVDATTDGVLIVRYLLGFRGTALVQGAFVPGHRDAAAIETYLGTLTP